MRTSTLLARLALTGVTTTLLALAAAPAHAQPADVPALTKLIDAQPADMDRSAWKEKRREAARKLVASKDKRAIPVLIKLAESETFDIIGEIAIEGLGNMGDASAVAPLQRVAGDVARDKVTRDLAKKALAKLGAATTGGGTSTGGGTTTTGGGTSTGGGTTTTGGGTSTTGGGATGGGTTTTGGGTTGGGATTDGGTTTTGGGTSAGGGGDTGGGDTGGGDTGGGDTGAGGGGLLGDRPANGAIPAGPDLPEDTLAAYDRLQFAVGTTTFAYDTVRKRSQFDGDVSGRYQKRIEREAMAWGFDAGGHVVAGFISPEGRQQTRGLQVTLDGGGEARFYRGALYGIGKAAAGLQLNYLSYVDDTDPNNDFKDSRTYADVQVALGGGYGRVLDVGGAIRVRRLGRILEAARALGKPIDAATAKRLQLAWWGLRGERSGHPALVATVAILREAGILLGEPDAGLSYELMTVLRDTQLFLRPSGLDVQIVVGEGFLIRPDPEDNTTGPVIPQRGRVEQLLAQASYGQQLAEDKAELSGTAYARMRLFAPSEFPEAQPSPWALGATARLRRFVYGEHGDPLGALDVSATVRLSDEGQLEGQENAPVAMRIGGEAGYSMFMNQASGLRLAGTVASDSGELFVGGSLTVTYGLLDGTFAGL